MKTCSKCKEEKELSEFYKNKSKKDGLSRECKECAKMSQKQYRQANKEQIAECKKRYYQANKEKISERDKQYHQANKEKITEQRKQYRQANKEKISERNKQYHQANKEKITEQRKQYRQANKEQIAEYDKQYRQANKEKIAERSKQYHQANKEQIAECKKRYYQANKEKISERNKQYRKRHRQNQPAAVYEIRNKLNGKVYIGQSTTYPTRKAQHKGYLKKGIHSNTLLQFDYSRHGEDAFEFSVVREFQCDAPQEFLMEQESIEMAIRIQRGETLYNSLLPSTELLKCDLELLESAITEFEHPIDHLQMIIETCNSQNVPLQLGLLALKQIKERE